MSYTPGVGVDVTIGLGLGYKEPVALSVSRADGIAYLTIAKVAGIRLDRAHLETLRDQLPGVLADLDVIGTVDERAAQAGSRAEALGHSLRDQADAADTAGESERAGELRGMADMLKALVDSLESALEVVSNAAQAVDDASERAKQLVDEQIAPKRSAGDQPAEGKGR